MFGVEDAATSSPLFDYVAGAHFSDTPGGFRGKRTSKRGHKSTGSGTSATKPRMTTSKTSGTSLPKCQLPRKSGVTTTVVASGRSKCNTVGPVVPKPAVQNLEPRATHAPVAFTRPEPRFVASRSDRKRTEPSTKEPSTVVSLADAWKSSKGYGGFATTSRTSNITYDNGNGRNGGRSHQATRLHSAPIPETKIVGQKPIPKRKMPVPKRIVVHEKREAEEEEEEEEAEELQDAENNEDEDREEEYVNAGSDKEDDNDKGHVQSQGNLDDNGDDNGDNVGEEDMEGDVEVVSNDEEEEEENGDTDVSGEDIPSESDGEADAEGDLEQEDEVIEAHDGVNEEAASDDNVDGEEEESGEGDGEEGDAEDDDEEENGKSKDGEEVENADGDDEDAIGPGDDNDAPECGDKDDDGVEMSHEEATDNNSGKKKKKKMARDVEDERTRSRKRASDSKHLIVELRREEEVSTVPMKVQPKHIASLPRPPAESKSRLATVESEPQSNVTIPRAATIQPENNNNNAKHDAHSKRGATVKSGGGGGVECSSVVNGVELGVGGGTKLGVGGGTKLDVDGGTKLSAGGGTRLDRGVVNRHGGSGAKRGSSDEVTQVVITGTKLEPHLNVSLSPDQKNVALIRVAPRHLKKTVTARPMTMTPTTMISTTITPTTSYTESKTMSKTSDDGRTKGVIVDGGGGGSIAAVMSVKCAPVGFGMTNESPRITMGTIEGVQPEASPRERKEGEAFVPIIPIVMAHPIATPSPIVMTRLLTPKISGCTCHPISTSTSSLPSVPRTSSSSSSSSSLSASLSASSSPLSAYVSSSRPANRQTLGDTQPAPLARAMIPFTPTSAFFTQCAAAATTTTLIHSDATVSRGSSAQNISLSSPSSSSPSSCMPISGSSSVATPTSTSCSVLSWVRDAPALALSSESLSMAVTSAFPSSLPSFSFPSTSVSTVVPSAVKSTSIVPPPNAVPFTRSTLHVSPCAMPSPTSISHVTSTTTKCCATTTSTSRSPSSSKPTAIAHTSTNRPLTSTSSVTNVVAPSSGSTPRLSSSAPSLLTSTSRPSPSLVLPVNPQIVLPATSSTSSSATPLPSSSPSSPSSVHNSRLSESTSVSASTTASRANPHENNATGDSRHRRKNTLVLRENTVLPENTVVLPEVGVLKTQSGSLPRPGIMESLFSGDGDTEPLRLYILRVLSGYSPERDYTYDKEPSEATFKAAVFAAFDRDWERADGRIAYNVLSELRAPIYTKTNGSRKTYEYGYGYVDIFLDCTFGQAVIELKNIPPKYIAPFFDGTANQTTQPSSTSLRTGSLIPTEHWRSHASTPSSTSTSSSSSSSSSSSLSSLTSSVSTSSGNPSKTVEEYLARFDAMSWRDRQTFVASKVRHIQTLNASEVGQLFVSPRPSADHKGPREVMTATALNERSERDQASRYNAFPNTPRDIQKKQILLCGTLLGPNSSWKLSVARKPLSSSTSTSDAAT